MPLDIKDYFFLEAGVVFFAGALAAGFFAEDFPFDLAVAITFIVLKWLCKCSGYFNNLIRLLANI